MKGGGQVRDQVRKYAGNLLLALSAVVVPVIAVAVQWPWPWWAWVAVVAPFLVGAILRLPRRPGPPREPTAFVTGDASGSRFGNVYSDADDFVHGNARRTVFWNITHRSQQHSRR